MGVNSLFSYVEYIFDYIWLDWTHLDDLQKGKGLV